MPPPRLNLYLNATSKVQWEQVKIPPTVKVVDKRLKSRGDTAATAPLFTGRVVDLLSQRPLGDVEIVAAKMASMKSGKLGRRVVADEDGTFRMADLAPQERTFLLQKAGYVPRFISINIVQGPNLEERQIALSPVCTLTGYARRANGTPVPGAQIMYFLPVALDGTAYETGHAMQGAVADNTGKFTITGLPVGSVTLRSALEKTINNDVICPVRTRTGRYYWERENAVIIRDNPQHASQSLPSEPDSP